MKALRHDCTILLPVAASLVLASLARAQAPSADSGRRADADGALAWVDWDGDLDLDLLALEEGRPRLFRNDEGALTDVTRPSGLAELDSVAFAVFGDYDGDGDEDLFVAHRDGPSRLLRLDGGVYEDVTLDAGLARPAVDRMAFWTDLDGDRAPELVVRDAATTTLFANRGDGTFEGEPLELAGVVVPPALGTSAPGLDALEAAGLELAFGAAGRPPLRRGDGASSSSVSAALGGMLPGVTPGGAGGAYQVVQGMALAAARVLDHADGTSLLEASSDPVLGKLYPLSSDLFVEAGTGYVGLNTTTPAYRLEATDSARTTAWIRSTSTDPGTLALRSDTTLGVAIKGTTGSSGTYGVWGQGPTGVRGTTTGNGATIAVHGVTSSTSVDAVAIVGEAPNSFNVGVRGSSLGNGVEGRGQGYGVVGLGLTGGFDVAVGVGGFGDSYGLYGIQEGNPTGMGVFGQGMGAGVVGYTDEPGGIGVRGTNDTSSGYAGEFEARVSGGIALLANNSSLSGDILVAANGVDVEFRVNSSGNVYCDGSFAGGGADYAEWLPRLDADETLAPGDVVGSHHGRITRRTAGAERVFVISTAPVLVGNAGEAETEGRDGYAIAAFMGQVPVRVVGDVHAGDLLLPSGREDGTARAVALAELRLADVSAVIGTAWEDASGPGEHRVNAAIGLDPQRVLARVAEALEEERDRDRRRLERIEQRLVALERGSSSDASAGVLARAAD